MKRIFLTILMMGLFSSGAKALTLVEATNTTITKLTVYSEREDGTVLIQVSTPPVGCDNGFWLSGTAAGVKHTISFLLAAKTMNSSVSINGDKDNIWSGTSVTGTCHLYNIDIL